MDSFDIYDDDFLYGDGPQGPGIPPKQPTPADQPPQQPPLRSPAQQPHSAAPAPNASAAATGLPAPPSRKRPADTAEDDQMQGHPPHKVAMTSHPKDEDLLAGYGDASRHGAISDADQPMTSVPSVGLENVILDSNCTCALQIDELSWWTSDSDIEQIAMLATQDPKCVRDVSFNEHKVNGKSRGSVWVLFTTPEAAAKTKAQFELIEIDGRMPQVSYADPSFNPFRALPKEGGSGARSGSGMPQHNPHQRPTSGLPPIPPRAPYPQQPQQQQSGGMPHHGGIPRGAPPHSGGYPQHHPHQGRGGPAGGYYSQQGGPYSQGPPQQHQYSGQGGYSAPLHPGAHYNPHHPAAVAAASQHGGPPAGGGSYSRPGPPTNQYAGAGGPAQAPNQYAAAHSGLPPAPRMRNGPPSSGPQVANGTAQPVAYGGYGY